MHRAIICNHMHNLFLEKPYFRSCRMELTYWKCNVTNVDVVDIDGDTHVDNYEVVTVDECLVMTSSVRFLHNLCCCKMCAHKTRVRTNVLNCFWWRQITYDGSLHRTIICNHHMFFAKNHISAVVEWNLHIGPSCGSVMAGQPRGVSSPRRKGLDCNYLGIGPLQSSKPH